MSAPADLFTRRSELEPECGQAATSPADFLAAVIEPGLHSLCTNDRGPFRVVAVVERDELPALAATIAGNVWLGVHPLAAQPADGKRGGGELIASVDVIQADVDWNDPAAPTAHAGTKLPTEPEVRAAVNRIDAELAPTAIVATGHGLQLYWRLAVSLAREEGQALQDLTTAWLATHGLDNERTDIASVMRMPGTMNVKVPDAPVLVVVEHCDAERRYVPQYLEKRFIAAGAKAGASSVSAGGRHQGDGTGAVREDVQELVDHLVENYGAHNVQRLPGGDVYVTRPDKPATRDSESAHVWIGTDNEAVVTVHTSAWPNVGPIRLTAGTTYVDGVDGKLHHAGDPLAKITFNASPPPGVDPATGEIVGELDGPAVPPTWSDAHVGEVFGDTLVGRWLHCRALGGWQQWDGRRWRTDPGEAVFEEFRQWIIAVGQQLWKADAPADTLKQVARYRERGKIDAAVTIARRLTPIAACVEEFDAHAHLLNVHNGVVDLRTGDLQPHDPALRLRQLAGAGYVAGATHPDIAAVLATMSPDVGRFMQKFFGSAAVGSVVDDVIAVLDGRGSNGKTTLLKAVSKALGDYATPASTRLLISKATNDEHPTLIADLFGRRLVYIEETPEGGSLKLEQLKALSGGGEVKARFIAKDQFTFTPTHQFCIATNHRPAVNASDYAAWRRLRLVPFPHTYRKVHEALPGDLVADLGLRGRLDQRRQREAALAWIVEGAVAWHDHGLGGCAEIDETTDEWRRGEDVIEAWWADEITVDPAGSVAAASLYVSFRDWCEFNGRRPPSNKEFVKKLVDHPLFETHGVMRRQTASGRFYDGFRLSPGARI